METLGTRLRSERERQKLTLEKVSELTKIREHIIKALEIGNYTVVPAVYAKSFIISYANLLKIPIFEIQEELDELFSTKLPEPVRFSEPEPKPERNWNLILNFNNLRALTKNKANVVNYLIYSVITFAMILVIYFSFFDSVEISNIVEESEATKNDTIEIKRENKGLFSFYEGPDSLILEAYANDSAWLKINIDGQISDQAYLQPNQSKRWSASEYFLITLGNAGAVDFKRNGEKLPSLGAIGTVVRNIKITAIEVINSSNPWENDSAAIAKRRLYRQKQKRESAMKNLEPATIEKSIESPMKNLRMTNEVDPSSMKRKQNEFRRIETPKTEEIKNPSNGDRL